MIRHLAIIMDGNRRWAKRQGLMPFYGHQKGAETIKEVIRFCLEKKIKFLSLYAFSLENFNSRCLAERLFIFNELLATQAEKNLALFLEHDVRVQFVGDRSSLEGNVLKSMSFLEHKTEHCQSLQLNILFCYGARQEIFAGIQKLISKIQNGVIPAYKITQKDFEQCLWSEGIPDPDLIIRTGGLRRLSNFLLYQAAYSEFYFLDCLWPEITMHHLEQALTYFNAIQRNFGI